MTSTATNYKPGDGFDALIKHELAVAALQDPTHCAVCECHLGMWYYGFPFPLCADCNERKRRGRRLCCPPMRKRRCGRPECQNSSHEIATARVLGTEDEEG